MRSLAAKADPAALVPCDVATRGESTCARTFLETFGLRAYRRPLTTDELGRLERSGRRRDLTDLLDQAQVSAMVQAAVAKFGGVHVLCNIAGGFRMGEAVHETSATTWNFLFDINARTLLHAARAVVPQMLAQSPDASGCRGKVINVGAFGAQKGGAQMGAYAASKAGVMRLTESMAAELREQGINVNAVLPTIIDTPQNRADMPGADPGKWVAPEALADVVLFLASDAARAVNGALVPVTGLS